MTYQIKIFLYNLLNWILAEPSPVAKSGWIVLLHLTEEKQRPISVWRSLQSEICLEKLQIFSPDFMFEWMINQKGKVEFTI